MAVLGHGADLRAECAYGGTALNYARESEQHAVVSYLEHLGAPEREY
jgi:hypothetical protein